jgi:hypothetical protein
MPGSWSSPNIAECGLAPAICMLKTDLDATSPAAAHLSPMITTILKAAPFLLNGRRGRGGAQGEHHLVGVEEQRVARSAGQKFYAGIDLSLVGSNLSGSLP